MFGPAECAAGIHRDIRDRTKTAPPDIPSLKALERVRLFPLPEEGPRPFTGPRGPGSCTRSPIRGEGRGARPRRPTARPSRSHAPPRGWELPLYWARRLSHGNYTDLCGARRADCVDVRIEGNSDYICSS